MWCSRRGQRGLARIVVSSTGCRTWAGNEPGSTGKKAGCPYGAVWGGAPRPHVSSEPGDYPELRGTAPIGQLTHCFESLIPPGAAFGLPMYSICLCGMWMEFARGLEFFRSSDKKIAPGLEMITPCPTARLWGLKTGATLGMIIAALGMDGQTNHSILGGFIHRTSGGDSCTLITAGPRLLCTPSLRPLSSSLSLIEESDIEDMKRLRERYIRPPSLRSAVAIRPPHHARATPMEFSVDAWSIPDTRAPPPVLLEPPAQGPPPTPPGTPAGTLVPGSTRRTHHSTRPAGDRTPSRGRAVTSRDPATPALPTV